MKSGNRIGIAHLKKYPKKLGISIPDDSEIDFTIKFGAFPIYVIAPIKTAPAEMANNVLGISTMRETGLPPAVLKKTRYVGALSRKPERIPVAQKYI